MMAKSHSSPGLSQHASFSPALNYYASKKLRREMAEQKAQLFLGIDTSTKPGSRSNETHDAMRAKLRELKLLPKHRLFQTLVP